MSNSYSEESVTSKKKHMFRSSPNRLSKLKNVGGMLEKPIELFRKDLISAMKLSDTERLFPEDYILISDRWKQDWEKGVQVPVNPETEKHCEVKIIEENIDMNGSYAFKILNELLPAVLDSNYKQSLHEMAEEVCRYDMDRLDEIWLKNYNLVRERCGQDKISGVLMEQIMQELETRCYVSLKAAELAAIEFDENTVCDVCRMSDVEEGNEMIFCDGCDIGVHLACYGVLKIPNGSWRCRTCALGLKPRCALCTNVGGAMKRTRDGTQWAHLSCAIWIPELSIDDLVKMEPISNIGVIPKTKWNQICCVCRERSGVCVQCSVKNCKNSFHVTCGFKKNYNMTINCDDSGTKPQLNAYCEVHSKDNEVSTGGSPKKGGQELKSTNRSRMKVVREDFYLQVKPEEVAEALGFESDTVSFIYEYWKLKRKSNFDKPLLMPRDEEETMQMKQNKGNLVTKLRLFIHLLHDLERVRNLYNMVIKKKRTHDQVNKELFLEQVESLKSQRPIAKDYEHIRRIHKQTQSLNDDHLQVERAASGYETHLAVEPKEYSDSDVYAFNSFTSTPSGGFISGNASQINTFKSSSTALKPTKYTSKVKATTSSPPLASSRNSASATKGRKRVASVDPSENPYARPQHEGFAWNDTRKKRKLFDPNKDANDDIDMKANVNEGELCLLVDGYKGGSASPQMIPSTSFETSVKHGNGNNLEVFVGSEVKTRGMVETEVKLVSVKKARGRKRLDAESAKLKARY